MEKYEQLSVVGEGSYGLVMKCRHRDTDQVVAIKKFLETEEDATLRRMALREIRMLKRLRHENLVTMIEVFRHRKRFYLVFEYVQGTVLDELEKYPDGLGDERTRERIFQVTRALHYCHSNNIIHRDVKPENVLVSSRGVVKLCDFGFARLVGGQGESYTEYVATRWYRAPELLVADQHYGAQVDIWAVGCLFSEMMSGEPLFPGESDIDQLYLIVKTLGKPCAKHQQLMSKNSQLKGFKKPPNQDQNALYKMFSSWPLLAVDFLSSCTKMDPQFRPTAEELLKHNYFIHDDFPERFTPVLREKVRQEFNDNPLLRKFKAEIFMSSTDLRRESEHSQRSTNNPHRKSQNPHEVSRWRINLIQGSMKRKFSSETIHSEDTKSLISLNKSGTKLASNYQKLGHITKGSIPVPKRDENTLEPIKSYEGSVTNLKASITKKEEVEKKADNSSVKKEESLTQNGKKEESVLVKKDENIMPVSSQPKIDLQPLIKEEKAPIGSGQKLGSLIVPRLSFEPARLPQRDNPRLEKALDLLSKLNKKNQYCRPKSTTKDLLYSNLPASPEFQSLQTHSFREISNQKSPAHTLHPSITNIGISSKDKKYSPQSTQSVNNLTLRSVFGQVPITHPPKNQFLKKLDKYVMVETTPLEKEVSRHNSPPDWMSSVGVAQKKRDPWKKSDDFSLPTVPGATGSPAKPKKKLIDDFSHTPIMRQNVLKYSIIDIKLKKPFPNERVGPY